MTGVAIVDLNGKLVSNLSASDLKGITESGFFKLEAPIFQVLETTPHKVLYQKKFGKNLKWLIFFLIKLGTITIQAEDTFSYLLKLFAEKRVHRIYVVDNEGKPTNVITLTTVLKMLV